MPVTLVAFDLKSGKELWRCGDDLASYSSPRPIEIGGETLVLIFARDSLLAVDPIAGQVRWQFDHRADIIESVNASKPVVVGEALLPRPSCIRMLAVDSSGYVTGWRWRGSRCPNSISVARAQ